MLEDALNGLLWAVVLSWVLWRPLEKVGVGLLFVFVVPYRLIKNRLQVGTWDIRPTIEVAEDILGTGEGGR